MMVLRDRERRGDGRESDCKFLQLRSGRRTVVGTPPLKEVRSPNQQTHEMILDNRGKKIYRKKILTINP